MKVSLATIPQQRDLERAYQAMLHTTSIAMSASQLALYSQWSRFDPRLAEIWVKFVIERWRKINPIELHDALLEQPWPAAAGVLLEFARRAAVGQGSLDSRLFKRWKEAVTESFSKENWAQYFIGQRRIAGKAMFDDARFALSEYRKWGYLSREILFNKQLLPNPSAGTTHTINPETRLEILKSLLLSLPRLSTVAYWNALGRSISRRQAERDLMNCPFLRARGRTKGRYFVKT